MNAQTLTVLRVGILLSPADLKILIVLSLRGPLTAGNLAERLELKHNYVVQRTAELEAHHLICCVAVSTPDATRLGWTIASSPGLEFALDALAKKLDVETFSVKNAG